MDHKSRFYIAHIVPPRMDPFGRSLDNLIELFTFYDPVSGIPLAQHFIRFPACLGGLPFNSIKVVKFDHLKQNDRELKRRTVSCYACDAGDSVNEN